MKHDHLPLLRAIKITVALALAAGMALSHKLWLTDRFFPHVPAFSFLPQPPVPFDKILFGSCILLLLLSAIFSSRRLILAAFIVFTSLLLLDQNRWQPWAFQYFLMLLLLSLVTWKREDKLRHLHLVTAMRLLMAGIYFYSGLQKLNPLFFSDTFPWLMEPFTTAPPDGILKGAAYLVPAIEIFIGIGLLLGRTRRLSIWLAIAMHLFILIALSPLGHNYNEVIWPWNLAMIILVLVLFRREGLNASTLKDTLRFKPALAVIIAAWLLPMLSFFNLWDSYLSSNLYSGNTCDAVLWMTDDVKERLPAEVKDHITGDKGQAHISVKYWAMMETGVPGYPEERVYRNITEQMNRYAVSDTSDIYLVFTEKSCLLSNRKSFLIE